MFVWRKTDQDREFSRSSGDGPVVQSCWNFHVTSHTVRRSQFHRTRFLLRHDVLHSVRVAFSCRKHVSPRTVRARLACPNVQRREGAGLLTAVSYFVESVAETRGRRAGSYAVATV